MFRFKQFSVNDDGCAMKVGTDGVLLGAWAMFSEEGVSGRPMRVLDVGTGSGLISLMLAQRYPEAEIVGLELDSVAVKRARENVCQSPFSGSISIIEGDFLDYTCEPFDHIVSNPPFFTETLLPPDASRATARHTASGLTFDALVAHVEMSLREGGSFQVILPKSAQTQFHDHCNRFGLTLVRATDVRTVQRKDPKRVLLHFVKNRNAVTPHRDELILMEDGQRSAQYTALCRDFYL